MEYNPDIDYIYNDEEFPSKGGILQSYRALKCYLWKKSGFISTDYYGVFTVNLGCIKTEVRKPFVTGTLSFNDGGFFSTNEVLMTFRSPILKDFENIYIPEFPIQLKIRYPNLTKLLNHLQNRSSLFPGVNLFYDKYYHQFCNFYKLTSPFPYYKQMDELLYTSIFNSATFVHLATDEYIHFKRSKLYTYLVYNNSKNKDIINWDKGIFYIYKLVKVGLALSGVSIIDNDINYDVDVNNDTDIDSMVDYLCSDNLTKDNNHAETVSFTGHFDSNDNTSDEYEQQIANAQSTHDYHLNKMQTTNDNDQLFYHSKKADEASSSEKYWESCKNESIISDNLNQLKRNEIDNLLSHSKKIEEIYKKS